MQDFRNSVFMYMTDLKNMNIKFFNDMKSIKFYLAALLLSMPLFQSCLDKGDDIDYSLLQPNAIVTVKPIDDASCYLQLDDKTALWPVSFGKSPYGDKEVRAFANYKEVEMPAGVDKEKYDKAVQINWLDSILTKAAVPTEGEEIDKEKYGTDPVEIFNDWMTVVEDGYITLHFYTLWGNSNIKHSVNLITGTNSEDPYEVVFRHNAFEDQCYYKGDGIAAFRLNEILPDTEGKTVTLTLKWESFNGTKSAEFDYCTRKD